MALAEQHLSARFPEAAELLAHRTYVIASDGDLMEGVSSEAASLAGQTLMPTLFVVNKDDLPGADKAETDLRDAYPGHTVIRTNFLDEANFDDLQAAIVSALGLRAVAVLDEPAADARAAPLLMRAGSSARDIAERAEGVDDSSVVAALVWGDSVKHPGQEVGLAHLVADGDRVHFRA